MIWSNIGILVEDCERFLGLDQPKGAPLRHFGRTIQYTSSQVTCANVLRFTSIGMTIVNALPMYCQSVVILD